MKKASSEKTKNTKRFAFGANWKAFLKTLDDKRIKAAEDSLKNMLGLSDLSHKRFLDIGSGSGLFSLAARRLGANVHSFDFDEASVKCTQECKNRFFAGDSAWSIEQGSALDKSYLLSLGTFDIVYSWGVLHHTGHMMQALRNTLFLVRDGGLLMIAIYNNQGFLSRFWFTIKKIYCSHRLGEWIIKAVFVPYFAARTVLSGLIKYRNPFAAFSRYKEKRGMSVYYDWIDWLGGFPFETAAPGKITAFYENAGFVLKKIRITHRLGCNEFVFQKPEKSGKK